MLICVFHVSISRHCKHGRDPLLLPRPRQVGERDLSPHHLPGRPALAREGARRQVLCGLGPGREVDLQAAGPGGAVARGGEAALGHIKDTEAVAGLGGGEEPGEEQTIFSVFFQN